jgi:hypothetical protein
MVRDPDLGRTQVQPGDTVRARCTSLDRPATTAASAQSRGIGGRTCPDRRRTGVSGSSQGYVSHTFRVPRRRCYGVGRVQLAFS